MRTSIFVSLVSVIALGAVGCKKTVEPQAQPESPEKLVAVPSDLVLTVQETQGVARTNEIVRSGVPIPRQMGLTTTDGLAVMDGNFNTVPAEFKVLARWNGPKNGNTPIQWLLVIFPATVPANGTVNYTVNYDGGVANIPHATPIATTQNGNQVTVNTGAATFVLGGDTNKLFDQIRLADGTAVVTGGALTGRANNTNFNHNGVRRVHIEHQGPLSTVVVIEGTYDLPAIGGGGLGSFRRYEFTAGSPTAIVRQAIAWEGDRCAQTSGGHGVLNCQGSMNGVKLNRLRDTLVVNASGARTVKVAGSFSGNLSTAGISNGQTAHVRQLRRATRVSPYSFNLSVPGNNSNGARADGAVLAVVDSSNRGIAIALDHMDEYEPQALRVLSNGNVAIDVADGDTWLGAKQGIYGRLAITALSANPNRAALNGSTWAPLNSPLRAWPSASWWDSSEAVDEVAVGTPTGQLAQYDTAIQTVVDRTLSQRAAYGLSGLSTFGLYPRHWAHWLYGDEIDCGGSDPTPGESWDNAYWCSFWTDYHNATMISLNRSFRTGDTDLVTEITVPAALRMLHTQIFQCAPGDEDFYCGQAPSGYGGFRENFNSSHAYFDNLMHYYWLTGDESVIDTIEVGANQMRSYMCTGRPAVGMCAPNTPTDDYWAQLSGRVPMQWTAVFRFLGLASDDASYLDDYRGNMARAITQHYAEVVQNGEHYGFWTGGGDIVTTGGTYITNQLWMASLYDMNSLYRLMIETQDAPLGNPGVRPSQIIHKWSKTLMQFGANVSGNGTINGTWPNELRFQFTGNRIGGNLTSVSAVTGGGDPNLYGTGKAILAGVLARAGRMTNDNAMLNMARDAAELAILDSIDENAPISKSPGEYQARLHAAVANLINQAGSCTPLTCGQLGAQCGAIPDGCGGTLSCGNCGSGETCTNNQCQGSCTPTTCQQAGAQCGTIADGCGGNLNCGGCASGQTCGGDNQCTGGNQCAHSECSEGAALDATCSSCAANVCAQDPYCCNTQWDDICTGLAENLCGNTCGNSCTPTTCQQAGAQCGTIADGCGGTLNCGGCTGGQTCQANQCTLTATCEHSECSEGGPLTNNCSACATTVCAQDPYCCNTAWDDVCTNLAENLCGNTCGNSCTPTTCQQAGAQCGNIADGCGGNLNCGGCSGNQTCNGQNQCESVCTPTTCQQAGASCGTIDDGCGGTLNCGGCGNGENCQSNQCVPVCTPTTCQQAGAACGSIPDGCGGNLNCGGCGNGQACQGNQCVCVPTTCAAAGAQCGSIDDGCGGTLNCGGCGNGSQCNAQNQCEALPMCVHSECSEGVRLDASCSSCATTVCAQDSYCCNTEWDDICVGLAEQHCGNTCGNSCTPTTCQQAGAQCGTIGDGCGGTLNCGGCGNGQSCNGQNQCTGGNTCGHDVCSEGAALTSGCNQCVTDVCDADPYCCNTEWDDVCVQAVPSICGQSC